MQFVWHGGEPLLRGPKFFERVFDDQRACASRVAYTNATHLDDDMLEFLLANDVSIGLSLDRPPALTDASRKPRRSLPVVNDASCGGASGPRRGVRAGAHATTVDAARRLQERGREAAAIVTVNATTSGTR